MKPVESHKGLSYQLLVWGFQPLDIVAILCVFVFLHGIIESFVLDVFVLVPLAWLAKKHRARPAGFMNSLLTFLIPPPRLPGGTRSDEAGPYPFSKREKQ